MSLSLFLSFYFYLFFFRGMGVSTSHPRAEAQSPRAMSECPLAIPTRELMGSQQFKAEFAVWVSTTPTALCTQQQHVVGLLLVLGGLGPHDRYTENNSRTSQASSGSHFVVGLVLWLNGKKTVGCEACLPLTLPPPLRALCLFLFLCVHMCVCAVLITTNLLVFLIFQARATGSPCLLDQRSYDIVTEAPGWPPACTCNQLSEKFARALPHPKELCKCV